MTNIDWNTIILHIDYDSFFASVEQQANPFLKNKPVAITGSSLTRGVVCTASYTAKRMGVKTGMSIFEAKKICPSIHCLAGDFTKYNYIHEKGLHIFNKYTDQLEEFSIDEVFLDVTKTLGFFGTIQSLIKQIKNDIKQEFGELITCSIGVGPNKLLAKLVSDINKPNGYFIVDANNLEAVLNNMELRDVCGIGKQILKRLNSMQIYSIKDLQKTERKDLYKEFGNIESNFLKNVGFGVGEAQVQISEYIRPVKSISHQHTLSKNTSNKEIIKFNIRQLTEMVTKRLRAVNMNAQNVSLTLRDSQKNWYSKQKRLSIVTSSSKLIYQAVEELFDTWQWNKDTRLIGVGVSNLIKDTLTTIPLFENQQRDQKIWALLDTINDKWGDFTIHPASTLQAEKTKGKLSSFLKHKGQKIVRDFMGTSKVLRI